MDFNVKVAMIPLGADPAELIAKDKELWQEALKNSKHVVHFFIEILKKGNYEERKFSLEVRKRILPYIGRIYNKIDRTHFVREIAEMLRVKEEDINEEISKLERSDLPMMGEKEDDLLPLRKLIDFKLSALKSYLLKQDHPAISPTALEKKYKEITGEDIKEFPEKEIAPMIFEIEKNEDDTTMIIIEANELLGRISREILEEALQQEVYKMKEVEKDNGLASIDEHLKKCQELSGKIESINKGDVVYF